MNYGINVLDDNGKIISKARGHDDVSLVSEVIKVLRTKGHHIIICGIDNTGIYDNVGTTIEDIDIEYRYKKPNISDFTLKNGITPNTDDLVYRGDAKPTTDDLVLRINTKPMTDDLVLRGTRPMHEPETNDPETTGFEPEFER